ncbi:hypothetical protein [Lysinibacillus capsici]|uniref:hypothetical protein n=1 Tax=Lysinibacillus capsici TaxID=2115968 RepID=UPI0034E53797
MKQASPVDLDVTLTMSIIPLLKVAYEMVADSFAAVVVENVPFLLIVVLPAIEFTTCVKLIIIFC